MIYELTAAEEPKHSTLRDRKATGRPDDFQTPPEALWPLLPYLAPFRLIWEPACGQGNLVRALRDAGHGVTGTDILDGHDFFRMSASFADAVVTNPPFSCKDAFLERCYDLGKPFALLMPLTCLEGRKRQALYRRHGLELILLDRRPEFTTPSGKTGGAWFPCGWFTHGLGVGQGLTFTQTAAPGGSLF